VTLAVVTSRDSSSGRFPSLHGGSIFHTIRYPARARRGETINGGKLMQKGVLLKERKKNPWGWVTGAKISPGCSDCATLDHVYSGAKNRKSPAHRRRRRATGLPPWSEV